MHRLSGPTCRGGAVERRLGQRAAHAAQRAAGGRRRALHRVELPPKIGDRGVRMILDARAEHRWDQHCSPCCGDDEENELGHKECGDRSEVREMER